MAEIIQRGNPVLSQRSLPVSREEFGSQELTQLLEDMKIALDKENDGVAIAAPQIGVLKRIFVVSPRAFDTNMEEPLPPSKEHLVFINPEIVKTSRGTIEMEEGCLSVRGYYGYINRHSKARVRAQNDEGKVFEMGGSGLIAQIFQHEIDHLDGILFVDKAHEICEM